VIRLGAFLAWAIGSAAGLVETYAGGLSLTRIPAIDSILISAAAQALINTRGKNAS